MKKHLKISLIRIGMAEIYFVCPNSRTCTLSNVSKHGVIIERINESARTYVCERLELAKTLPENKLEGCPTLLHLKYLKDAED